MMKDMNTNTSLSFTPSVRVWLCGTFRVERQSGGGYEPVRVTDWGGSNYPRLLLKALLCCPGRQARREALLEMLWPDADPEQSTQYLNTATTKLRKVLQLSKGQAPLFITEEDARRYRLEGQRLLWVDVDEARALLNQAESLGRTSPEALPVLERATEYLSQGGFLEEEEGVWVSSRRATVDQMRYRSRLWLSEAYIQQKKYGQAEVILGALLEDDPFDEDVLCRLMRLLHQQGMTHQALKLYARICDMFATEGLETTKSTKELVIQLQEERHSTSAILAHSTLPHSIISLFQQANPEHTMLSQFATAISQGIILAAKQLDKKEMQTLLASGLPGSQRKIPQDILAYKRNIRLALHLHRTSTAQGLLQDVDTDISYLEQIERQANGHDLYDVKELLIGNHLLATKIVKDKQQYEHAYRYANNAVRVAKSLEDGDFIATTKYMRGCVKFEWAQFGTVKQGILQLNRAKVQEAIRDFQDVLNIAHSQRTPLHPQLQGYTLLQLSRAYSLLHDDQNDSLATKPLTFVDQAEDMVGCDSIDDAYTRLIVTGTISGLHWGAYHLNKAEIFIAMGMRDQAIAELKQLQQLTERTYARDETRNLTWSNVVMAEALMGWEVYPEVASTLRSAFLACRSINSLQNAAIIRDMYSRLAISSYGKSADVQEIGMMLKEWYGRA